MRKFFVCFPWATALLLCGCSADGGKTTSLSAVYGAAAALAMLILLGYVFSVKQRDRLFVLLFSAVSIVNTGYFLLARSAALEQALWANRLAYLGSVFLPLCMLLIILGAANIRYPKHLPPLLTALAAVMLLIAASPGVLEIYYREVSFVIANGTGMLQKVYGPLHCLYGIYLLGYFIAMIAVIAYAAAKKTTHSTGHVVILAIAVFVNLGVWFIEQLVRIDFEFLAVSYLISELFLLGLHLVLTEQQALQLAAEEAAAQAEAAEKQVESAEPPQSRPTSGREQLTQTERLIFEAYLQRKTTKEIMAQLNIKENTLKFHNKNLYQKLGVSSRKELQAIYTPAGDEDPPQKNRASAQNKQRG